MSIILCSIIIKIEQKESCFALTIGKRKGFQSMLNYHIRGENIEVTDAIRSYVEKKVGKLEKYFDKAPDATTHTNLKVYPNKTAKAEVTIPLPHIVLRAEEVTDDLYASIDLVVDKLERQIRKFKTKLNRKTRGKTVPEKVTDLPSLEEKKDENEPEFDIVRTKRFSLKPMDSEEAVLQMNLLGHNFFIFEDAETNGTSIVYRRKDGKYGLLETD